MRAQEGRLTELGRRKSGKPKMGRQLRAKGVREGASSFDFQYALFKLI